MSFDLATLRNLTAQHTRVARVVVAAVKGSAPREVGAAIYVWDGGQSGSIGGGALEYQAAQNALEAPLLQRIPLGPNLGQCCGGSVTLVTEVFTVETLPTSTTDRFSRVVATQAANNPPEALGLHAGWFSEEISPEKTPLWIWGAGHVGRAVAATMAPLPDFDVTLIDTSAPRMPAPIAHVTPLIAADLPNLVQYAPASARHLIMTYDHAIDLALCAALLAVPHRDIGLIGSATKWARFRRRLAALNFENAQINSIACPIGDPHLGKHPQAIAVSVAGALILDSQTKNHASDSAHNSDRGAA
jgi:xanthine dehydrogenase accessory factor